MIGLEEWFANFSQIARSWNSAEGLATVPRPHLEYAIWATLKAAEGMSILGGCVAHPIYRFYQYRKIVQSEVTPNTMKIIRNRSRHLQGRFLIAGVVVAPFLSRVYTHFMGFTDNEVKNKCYAIRCDAHELTMDRCAVVCGFIGWYWKRFQGAVDGINIGIAYALANIHILAPRTSPVLKDAIPTEQRYKTVEEVEEGRTKLERFMYVNDRK